jgi:putative nucleotidyltransferase with HDIG domain
MREEIIKRADEFIQKELIKLAEYKDNNMRMAEYRIEHSYRVAHIGLQIARAEGFDEERTFVACLLHDIGYAIDFTDENDYINHGRYGAAIAGPFLKELGYSPEDVNEMCFGIAIHVDDNADFEGERTPLALTIGDADNIDRFDAFRLYEGLQTMDYMNLPILEQKALVEKRLERLKQLREMPFGTVTATKLWQDKIDYQIEFYNRLKLQVENSFIRFRLEDSFYE